MPPSMLPMLGARTKLNRRNKCFECVIVGPIKLYFSHWELIAFETDKTKLFVCQPEKRYVTATHAPGDILRYRMEIEPDRSKWVTPNEFSEKWAEVGALYFK